MAEVHGRQPQWPKIFGAIAVLHRSCHSRDTGQARDLRRRVGRGTIEDVERRERHRDGQIRLAIGDLDLLIPLGDPSLPYIAHAKSALAALDAWNSGGDIDAVVSPVRDVRHDSVLPDPEAFFSTRHSVRDFANRRVDGSLIKRAVELALYSPSVCNRQSWKMYIRHGDEATQALRYQNGSAAFRHAVPAVAIITADARAFAGPKERNQAWIDGGIFAMSFVWALHAVGLDSCMLNMSVPRAKAAALREHIGAADSELVVMMVAFGYGREGHRRARSPRRTAESVLSDE